MCLLKPSELNNNNCAHDECKNFRMLNKPACIYSFNPAGKSILTQQSQHSSNSAPQNQDILAPRPANYLSNSSHEEIEDDSSFVLNKKKLKVESKNGYGVEAKPAGIQSDMNGQPIMMNGQYQQIVANNGFDDKSLFNAPMLNNILLSNGNKSNSQASGQVPVMQVTQPLYIPYMPNQMGQMGLVDQNMQNISYIPVQQGFQQGFQPQVQNFQKMKPLDMNMNLQSVSTPSSAENFQRNFNIEEYMNQFQNKLSEVLVSQNKMLIDLREKNDLVQDTLACLINEINALKQVVKQNNTTTEKGGFINSNKAAQLNQQFTESSREIASSESLLTSLYGPSANFQYQLVFKSELPLPLYRERNFKFTVFLTDKDGNLVKNANRIPLSLAIYTSENPPKFIDVNTSGNKILKGVIDKDMVDGAVTFDKIQIKEVTSHFRNGWIFFVVYPKAAGIVFNNMMPNGNTVVDHNKLRPLVLEKVVVKAKKIKEKNTDENQDDESVEQEA